MTPTTTRSDLLTASNVRKTYVRFMGRVPSRRSPMSELLDAVDALVASAAACRRT